MTEPGGSWRSGGMPGMGQAFRVLQARPSGPGRIAMLVFLIILALPLLALAIIAGIVSMAVFLVLAGWNRLFRRATPDWASHDSDGRKGVRVKR